MHLQRLVIHIVEQDHRGVKRVTRPVFGGPRSGGRRATVPTSAGGGGWLKARGAGGGARGEAVCRRAPWGRHAVAEVDTAASTEPRTGADRPQWQCVPVRVSVPGGGSPLAVRHYSSIMKGGGVKQWTELSTTSLAIDA